MSVESGSSPTIASSSKAGPSTSTWHSRFGRSRDDGGREPLQRWIAISLIALPTVALLVPGYRVYRMSRASKLASPPPVRRTFLPQHTPTHARHLASTSVPLPLTSHPPPRRASLPSGSPPPKRIPSKAALPISSSFAEHPPIDVKEKTPAEEEADATALEAAKDPLYAAGAFTLATALVGLGLFTGVWATKTVLGVDNVEEFAARMRALIRRHIPQLSEKLYMNEEQTTAVDGSAILGGSSHGFTQWDTSASEVRLREAFDRGGVEAWAECALREMEAERRLTVEAVRGRT